MTDPLLALDKVIATLKLNMLGEVCKVRFVDGIRIKVDSNRFGFRTLGQVHAMDQERIVIRFASAENMLKKMKGLGVEISFSVDGDFYYFETTILEQKGKDVIVVQRPTQVHKTQRREYLRLPIQAPIKIRSIDNKELDTLFQTKYAAQVITKDISGGGIRLESAETTDQSEGIEVILDETLEKNSLVEIEIGLTDVNRTVKALGKVAWINKSGDKYEIGITYLNIVKSDQDFLVRYILNEQIRRSKLKDLKNIRKN